MFQWFVVVTLISSSASLVECCMSSKTINSCGVTKNMDIGDISPDMCTHIIVSKYSIYFDNVLGMASADSVKDMIPATMINIFKKLKKKNKKLEVLLEIEFFDEKPVDEEDLDSYSAMDDFLLAVWETYPVDGLVLDNSVARQDKVDKLFSHLSQLVNRKGKSMWLRGRYQDNSLNPASGNYNESFEHVIMEMKKTAIIKTDDDSFESDLDDIVTKWSKLGFSKTQMIMEYSMHPMAYEIVAIINDHTVQINEDSGVHTIKGFEKDVQRAIDDDKLMSRLNVVLMNPTHILILNAGSCTANKVIHLSENYDLNNFHLSGLDGNFRLVRDFYQVKGLKETQLI